MLTLPTFLIAGGRRCGTSSLYHWLRAHPDVHLPEQQDTMYFVDERLRGRSDAGKIAAADWEARHDPADYAERFASAAGRTAVGEKCADILFWERAQERLVRYVPGVRLVVTLRDPVTRAWSHYWNEVGKGRESLPFDAALAREAERAAASTWAHFHLSYAARGYYDESLGRLFRHVPRERVHVLVMERTAADPATALRRVCTFLGVDPARLPADPDHGSRHNSNWTTVRRPWVDALGLGGVESAYGRVARRVASRLARDRADRATRERTLTARLTLPFRAPATAARLSPDVEAELRSRFAPHTDRLRDMLGDALPEWPR